MITHFFLEHAWYLGGGVLSVSPHHPTLTTASILDATMAGLSQVSLGRFIPFLFEENCFICIQPALRIVILLGDLILQGSANFGDQWSLVS